GRDAHLDGMAEVHGADHARVVVDRDDGGGDADDGEPRPAALDGSREGIKLAEEEACRRQTDESEHEEAHGDSEERALPAEAGEAVEGDGPGELALTRADNREGAEVHRGVRDEIEEEGATAERGG